MSEQHELTAALIGASRLVLWPRALSASDLAEIFETSPRTARARMARGDYGRTVVIGRRRWVLREDLLAHLNRPSSEQPDASVATEVAP